MSDKPILFSAPMVRAILREIEQPGTGKTQTRRVLDQSQFHADCVEVCRYSDDDQTLVQRHGMDGSICGTVKVAYQPGDRLYAREAWRTLQSNDILAPRQLADDRSKVTYEADSENRNPLWAFGKYRQGMHMPRWASRITLIVTDVRVQRLQEISAHDAISEGIEQTMPDDDPWLWRDYQRGGDCDNPALSFKTLWDSINGDRPGAAWRYNPWVAAISFKPVLGNIDQIGGA